MSQWKNTDDAANSVLWGVSNYNKAPNTANRDAFFGNTTAGAFVTGATVGQYAVIPAEMAAARAGGIAKPAHAGFANKIVGSGGRAGRVSYEVLVASRSITGDSEDVSFPDYAIVISSQPVSANGDVSNNDSRTFTVTAATVPTGGSITYQWQYSNGTNIGAGSSGNTTATLTANAGAGPFATPGTYTIRALLQATGAANVYTSNVTFTTVA